MHTTAQNIAGLVQALHEKGYIIGDLQGKNLLVNNQALVTIVDTDSFQVPNPDSQTFYPCNVTTAEYTPPELYGKELSNTILNVYHDYFRLGIVIYYLLFGDHPFSGEWRGMGEPPRQDQCIRHGWWPYSDSVNKFIVPSSKTIPLEILHPQLRDYFIRCFNQGHQDPTQRPTAKDWYTAITVAVKELTICNQNSNHVYSKHYQLTYDQCYWCERHKNLGVDIFSSKLVQPKHNTAIPKHNTAISPLIVLVVIAIIIVIIVIAIFIR